MNLTASNQIALDNALVPPEARLKIGECNRRIKFSKPQREATYQITLDALKLSPCYPAFLITAGVPEIYMHQFWITVTKVKDSLSYQFKIDNKKFRVNAEIENHFSKESMPYPRFTKIIINHFISQNKSIFMRNRINLHTARDDSLLGTLKYVSKTEEHQVYRALIPKEMRNEDILNSTAYKTYYAYASGAKEPKKERKFKKPASPKLKNVPVSPKEPTKKPGKAKKDVTSTKKTTTKPKPKKKKASVKADRGKGDGTDFESGVPDEQQCKISGTDKRTGAKLGVPDVPKCDSESDKESWGDSGEDDDDDDEDDTEDDADNAKKGD
ncbi:hypothetical protein Tco_0088541 [Tanacetum coccineum]